MQPVKMKLLTMNLESNNISFMLILLPARKKLVMFLKISYEYINKNFKIHKVLCNL